MSAKNTTAARRGAMLAKELLALRKHGVTPTLEQLEAGNRQMRRVAAKQRKKEEA